MSYVEGFNSNNRVDYSSHNSKKVKEHDKQAQNEEILLKFQATEQNCNDNNTKADPYQLDDSDKECLEMLNSDSNYEYFDGSNDSSATDAIVTENGISAGATNQAITTPIEE